MICKETWNSGRETWKKTKSFGEKVSENIKFVTWISFRFAKWKSWSFGEKVSGKIKTSEEYRTILMWDTWRLKKVNWIYMKFQWKSFGKHKISFIGVSRSFSEKVSGKDKNERRELGEIQSTYRRWRKVNWILEVFIIGVSRSFSEKVSGKHRSFEKFYEIEIVGK